MLEGDHVSLLHMMRPSHWASPLNDRSFQAEREWRGLHRQRTSTAEDISDCSYTTSQLGSPVHSCREDTQRVRNLCDFTGSGSSSGRTTLIPEHVWILMFPVNFCAAASVWLLPALPQESLSHYSHVLHLSKCPEKTGMWKGCQQPGWTKSLRAKTFFPGPWNEHQKPCNTDKQMSSATCVHFLVLLVVVEDKSEVLGTGGRGPIPRLFMKERSCSGISARTSFASRAMLSTWFPERSM